MRRLKKSAITLLFDGTWPLIQCRLAGDDATCLLDTGSHTVFITKPFIDAHPNVLPKWFGDPATQPMIPMRGIVAAGLGGPSKGRIGQLSSVQFGPNIVRNIDQTDFSLDEKGAGADPFFAAIVGNRVLKQFTMTLDYPHATLRLVPNRGPD